MGVVDLWAEDDRYSSALLLVRVRVYVRHQRCCTYQCVVQASGSQSPHCLWGQYHHTHSDTACAELQQGQYWSDLCKADGWYNSALLSSKARVYVGPEVLYLPLCC
jgi:hypothetical protein